MSQRYVLLREIGEGGMGVVHRARDQALERDTALKLLHLHLRRDEHYSESFVEEARITGQLDHPSIVPVHELGEGEESLYFSMKLVEGETLEELVAELGELRLERRQLDELLRIFLKVCEAVAFAHSRGVVHRDLKPANVMVGEFGQVYVMDWGVALRQTPKDQRSDHKTPDDTLDDSDPTGSHNIIGTPAYMSPEQARGRQDLVDEQSDVFLLGSTLYHILTGRAPYLAANRIRQLMLALECGFPALDDVVGPGRLPQQLVAIVRRAMAANHKERYPSVAALRHDMEHFLSGTWDQTLRTFPPGARIVTEGEAGDEAYVIRQGRCAVIAETDQGRRVLRELGPGEVFGEAAVFLSQPRSATVEAIDEVTVAVVDRVALTEGLGLNSPLGIFIKALADRFAEADQRLRRQDDPDPENESP